MKPDPASSLYANFERTARSNPGRRAFTFLDSALHESAYTVERLFAAVHDVAHHLAACELAPELPLAILVETQEQQILHYLAAMSLGLTPAILTPPHRKLNRDYYLETTRAIFRYAHFSAVITNLAELDAECLMLEPIVCSASRQRVLRSRGEEFPATKGSAFLQFSSGTTGIKRGVLVSDAAAVAQILAYSAVIALSGSDCIVSWLPLYHDMGFMTGLNMALACGVHSVMVNPIDWVTNPSLYLHAVSRYRGTLSWHPNFAYAFMADRASRNDVDIVSLESLRGLVNCSEPVTKESQKRFEARFLQSGLRSGVFWGCYAMAETTFALTHGQSSDLSYYDSIGPTSYYARNSTEPMVSVGRPIAGVELAIVGEDGTQLGERAVGELWVKSPFNLSGYYNNPEATASAVHENWYKTGDLGYQAAGELFICGRKKDLLIIGGVNIAPQDVEDAVSQLPGIPAGRVSVFAEFDGATQTERATILAETATAPEERSELLVRVRQFVIAQFQMTSFNVHFVPLGWLVKSSSGKMARTANRDKWHKNQVPHDEGQNDRPASLESNG